MKKKLIEVSLPLEAINVASAREKSIRHGHPSTLHLWWARRPLAACRAVLFASLVDDPSSLSDEFPTEELQIKERRRLHEIIERLVLWENSNNETVLAEARAEIMRSTNNNPPPVYDPFAGGGSIPLEAQRLGLEAHASDLNPVAVLINKALIEIPPKFAGQPPVNPESREKLDHTKSWKGAQGLAEDVRYYGKWMRDEAERRIGHLYPKVKVVQESDGTFRHATDEEIASSERGHPARESSPTWHSRGYLPHFESENTLQTITFRLHDALPQSVLKKLESELDQLSEDEIGITETGLDAREVERRKRIEKYLDAGYGECYLRDERIAEIVKDALLHFDGKRYELHEWVIMPNHVHVLIKPLAGQTLSAILHSWKSFTAKEANKTLGRSGDFWQVEYYDRYIRNQEHYDNAVRYIRENPVKAGLVKNAEDWKYSSASMKKENAGKMPALRRLTVIAWLWARTVKCPNPTCGAVMPLVRSFALSTKKGKEAHVSPIIDHENKTIRFSIQNPKSKIQNQTGTVDRRGARCLVCETLAPLDHVRAEGKAGRMAAQMMAIVAEGNRGRIYLAPNAEQASIAAEAAPENVPDTDLPEQALGFRVQGYGMTKHRDLFTNRQLVALTTFSDLVGEARTKVFEDYRRSAGILPATLSANEPRENEEASKASDAGKMPALRRENAESYADGMAIYLTFAVSRMTDYLCTIATWASNPQMEIVRSTFSRQAIPMTWDFAEANPFAHSSGSLEILLGWIEKAINRLPVSGNAQVKQIDATVLNDSISPMFSTDPPYYDNIGYADLSDFFYIWLRRSLINFYPKLFGTLLVPKKTELVATPFRFDGSKIKAKEFFENGLQNVFRKMRETQNPNFPLTVYYAFKQSESEDGDDENKVVTASTGWETMLEGLINSGFQITGTIPVRTERSGRSISIGTNALASSIVLVCRPRPEDTPTATRGEFLRSLKKELPDALRKLQESNIAPVDLAQASIGPGMAVYSRYSRVVESDGSPMKVRAALGIINQILDEVLAEQDSEYDSETRWAIDWFAQFGMNAGAYGDAEILSKAKNTSVAGMESSGIISSRAGKVKLLARDELKPDWNPDVDSRLTIWEITQHLIRILETQGEQAAAKILNSEAVGWQGDIAKDLAYRLYNFCERKGWAQEALAYNSLIVSWNDVQKQASELAGEKAAEQASFDFE